MVGSTTGATKSGPHGELLGERALEGRDDLVVQRARIDVRFFNHTHDSLKLSNRVHTLEGTDEQQARHVPARVALALWRADEPLLDVVVDHGPGEGLLVGQAHEGELVADEGYDLVEVQLDARELINAVDVHGGHVLCERTGARLRVVRGDLARGLGVLLGLFGAHAPSRKV